MDFTTIIFAVGATLAIATFALKNMFYLRITALGACLCSVCYYFMTSKDMYPIVLNAIVAAINAFYLLKMRLNNKEWKAIQRYKRIHRMKKERKKLAKTTRENIL